MPLPVGRVEHAISPVECEEACSTRPTKPWGRPTMTTVPADPIVASTASIRSRFPALARMHGGERVAYFDGPGGTQVPRSVVEAVADYLIGHNANTHWSFPTSQETDQALA